jgi:hypothetical protein
MALRSDIWAKGGHLGLSSALLGSVSVPGSCVWARNSSILTVGSANRQCSHEGNADLSPQCITRHVSSCPQSEQLGGEQQELPSREQAALQGETQPTNADAGLGEVEEQRKPHFKEAEQRRTRGGQPSALGFLGRVFAGWGRRTPRPLKRAASSSLQPSVGGAGGEPWQLDNCIPILQAGRWANATQQRCGGRGLKQGGGSLVRQGGCSMLGPAGYPPACCCEMPAAGARRLPNALMCQGEGARAGHSLPA